MKRMIRVVLFVVSGAGLLLAAGAVGWYSHTYFGDSELAPAQTSEAWEGQAMATLDEMVKNHAREFGVPTADGRRLRLLAESAGAKNVVEVGTSTGYSGLWLALGVRRTGGHVTTFEIDPRRAATARGYFRKAGLQDYITVVEGDAHKNVGSVKGPIDLVFLDADKEGYSDYLKQLLPRIRQGGLILAHNIDDAPEYLRYVTTNPDLETIPLTQGSGLCVTMKKR